MSVRWTRTALIKNSRVMEAVGWSKEISGWVEKKYNVKVETWIDAVGQVGTIRWSVDYPDLGTFDTTFTKVQSDPDYWNYVQKAMKDDIFVDGSGVDTISKRV